MRGRVAGEDEASLVEEVDWTADDEDGGGDDDNGREGEGGGHEEEDEEIDAASMSRFDF